MVGKAEYLIVELYVGVAGVYPVTVNGKVATLYGLAKNLAIVCLNPKSAALATSSE
jgi:hypothetical protein